MESFLKKKFKAGLGHKTASVKETGAIGLKFARGLKPGDIIALSGDLGAGKTHFVKGAAVFFGISAGHIVSPTFSLVKTHKGAALRVNHFDFYRLKGIDELEKTGYREYISDENSITFIEWPEIVAETWDDFTHAVRIEHAGGNNRIIKVYAKKKGNKRRNRSKK